MSKDFPFTAILGQEAMQTALLLATIDPTIGGVLVRGQKGTAKSTAARALAKLLPSIEVVSDCPYHCNPDQLETLHDACRDKLAAEGALPREQRPTPFVDLPLSATEDRLIGTLHLEKTLQSGARQFAPGLFAAAHRGLLYVDEVNLLPDHLVDLLLDTAVSGVNRVEREGLHYTHDSRFLLIGTMNPEEGELRPQFLDRFGLCVSVTAVDDSGLRQEIVRRRLAFDQAVDQFTDSFVDQEDTLRQQIVQARKRLAAVAIPTDTLAHAVSLASDAEAQGHRAELALVRAARALAALFERDRVTSVDIDAVAGFALAHRFPGMSVLTQEEVASKLALAARPSASVASAEKQTEVDLDSIDMVDFPGSAAAGSALFAYLKKKSKTGSSPPTNPSN